MLINKLDNVRVNLTDGHKYAIRPIKKGENIIKYGNPIGHATEDIKNGEHVHTHNVKTALGDKITYTYAPFTDSGEKAETVKVLNSLLAVPTTEGFHEIEFVYRPISYTIGMPLTVIGILSFVGFILLSMFKKLRITEKAGAEKTTHFFWCKGDEAIGWLLEAEETALANAPDEGGDVPAVIVKDAEACAQEIPAAEEITSSEAAEETK